MMDKIEQNTASNHISHANLEAPIGQSLPALCEILERLDRECAKGRPPQCSLCQPGRKLRAVLDTSLDPIVIVDAQGIIEDVSRSMQRVLGWNRDELIGQQVDILIPESHRSQQSQYIADYLRTGTSHVMGKPQRLDLVRKDQTLVVCEVTIWRPEIAGRDPPFFSVLIRDVTDRVRAQEELESLNKQLVVAAHRAGRAETAVSVLHNVGNVLTSVNVSAGLIEEKCRQSSLHDLEKVAGIIEQNAPCFGEYVTHDERGKHLPGFLIQLARKMADDQQELLAEVRSLIKNVDHIKDIIAIQQNHARLSGLIEEISLVDLVEDAIRINSASVERHHITIVRQFEGPPLIYVDKQLVLQILINLISNAKYALIESNTADQRIHVRIERNGDHVRVEVADNGVGISEENLTHVFQRGFTTRKGGHGLGLHSAAYAALELRGTLRAFSEGEGKGATFVLEIPVWETAESGKVISEPLET